MALNEGISFKKWIIDLIKWCPSYYGIEYMMSSS